MRILGISAFSRSAAAALVEDGHIVAAVREDRLLRQACAATYPMRSINACLQAGEVTLDEIDFVVFHEKPFLKFARVAKDFLATWPHSFRAALATLPAWLEDGLVPNLVLERETGIASKCLFLKHHLSHAASAFLLSPFEEAAVLCLDGVGEEACASWGEGRGDRVTVRQEQRFPDSAGFVVRAVADYLGLARHGSEATLADLAASGEPSQLEGLRKIVTIHEDGSFQVDQSFLPFRAGQCLYSGDFIRTFGAPRGPGQEIEQRHLDLAASLQALLEEIGLAMARHVARQTGAEKICLAGGVAGNAALCSRILEEGIFGDLFVPPAPGSDGAALGAALAVACAHGDPRPPPLENPFLGPSWPAAHVRRVLTNAGLAFSEPEPDALAATVARLVKEQGAVGWFNGRVEFSSRPLASRAILFDPSRPDVLARVRGRLGASRPAAGAGLAVPQQQASDWFALDRPSPFGLLAPLPRGETWQACSALLGGHRRVPVHTVGPENSRLLLDTLEHLGRRSGCPIAAVVALEAEGEPMACRPEEALEVCRAAGLGCLLAEGLLAELPDAPTA